MAVPAALPIYANIALNGSAVRLRQQRRDGGMYNKIGNRLFLRFSLQRRRERDDQGAIHVGRVRSAARRPAPDPDIVLFKGRLPRDRRESAAADQEDARRTLQAGEYVIEVYEWSHIDPPTSGDDPRPHLFQCHITG